MSKIIIVKEDNLKKIDGRGLLNVIRYKYQYILDLNFNNIGNGEELIRKQKNGLLKMKSIKAGKNIEIVETEDKIIINSKNLLKTYHDLNLDLNYDLNNNLNDYLDNRLEYYSLLKDNFIIKNLLGEGLILIDELFNIKYLLNDNTNLLEINDNCYHFKNIIAGKNIKIQNKDLIFIEADNEQLKTFTENTNLINKFNCIKSLKGKNNLEISLKDETIYLKLKDIPKHYTSSHNVKCVSTDHINLISKNYQVCRLKFDCNCLLEEKIKLINLNPISYNSGIYNLDFFSFTETKEYSACFNLDLNSENNDNLIVKFNDDIILDVNILKGKNIFTSSLLLKLKLNTKYNLFAYFNSKIQLNSITINII